MAQQLSHRFLAQYCTELLTNLKEADHCLLTSVIYDPIACFRISGLNPLLPLDTEQENPELALTFLLAS